MNGHEECLNGHEECLNGHEECLNGHEECLNGHEECLNAYNVGNTLHSVNKPESDRSKQQKGSHIILFFTNGSQYM